MPPLVLDSNALIGWWYHWYCPHQHGFWDALEREAAKQRLLVSEEVYDELTKWHELCAWMEERRGLFLKATDDEITDKVTELVNKYRYKLHLTSKENSADLYVIAITALTEDAKLVTDERAARQRRETGEVEGKYRIPNICRLEDIEVLRSYEVPQMAGWRFEWRPGPPVTRG